MDLNQVLSLFTKGSVERKGAFQRVALLDGSEYMGDIASGRRHGVGFMTWPDGLRYLGEWVDNAATGEGILLWPDGAEYYGQVVRGKRHGRGLYIDASGHYAGEWRAGLRHGLGTQITTDSSVYCGEWLNGARCGWGNITYATGNHYEGLWHDDVMCGYGSMTWVMTAKPHLPHAAGSSYGAASSHGNGSVNLNATGTLQSTINSLIATDDIGNLTLDKVRPLTYNIGALEPGPLGPFNPSLASSEAVFERYVGSWRGGQPHGSGEYALFFHDGAARDNPFQTINHYVGEFQKGVRHGKGTQLYADGRVFEGEWVANVKAGHGYLTMPDGTKSSVIVKDDVVMASPTPTPNSSSKKNAEAAAKVNASGVVSDINVSTEDALQIGDIASDKEVADIKGLVTNYKPMLKYLYTAYATIQPQPAYFGAIEQLLCAEDDVPNPDFLDHPVAATIPSLQGISKEKRNKRMCQRASEVIHNETVRNANGIAHRFSRAAEAMGEGSAFGKGLAAVESQQSVADDAFNRTYAPAKPTFKSKIEVAMPLSAPSADRKALQNSLTRAQFLQFLDDARVLDTSLPTTRVNVLVAAAVARDPNRTVTPPQPMRAMLRGVDKTTDQMSFGVFVESIVRIAEARMAGEGPWFTSCVLNNFSLSHRVQLFCDYYIVPLGNALQAMAAHETLRCIGIEPYFATTFGNQTIPEMKRNAARVLLAMREKAKGNVAKAPSHREKEDDASLAAAIGATLDESNASTNVATIVHKQPIRVDGTLNDALQLWTIECLDTATQIHNYHAIIVHNNEDGLGFGGIVLQRTREDLAECLAKSPVRLQVPFVLPLLPPNGEGKEQMLAPIPVSAEIIARVPCVAQQVERNLLVILRVFEALQREERGVCRLSDVLNILYLAGFIKPKRKRVVKTVIENKPKPPPPAPVGKEKGKGSKASPPERRPSTPVKSAGGAGAKMNKKQLQIQAALDAEAALKRQEAELERQRMEALRRADELPEPESLHMLPPSEVSMDVILRGVLLEVHHLLLGEGLISYVPHRVPFDTSATIAAIAEANSPITRHLCRVSPSLEEVIQLQRMAAKESEERCAKARPVPTPSGTQQAMLLGDTVLLSLSDFISTLVCVFLTAYPSRTPLQAIRAGFLYLPKMLSIVSSYRNVQAPMPPLIDNDMPLPVRLKPVPEDPKARGKK